MELLSSSKKNLLLDILSQPTAPFREGHVIARICKELDTHSVPYLIDPVGNIVVGVGSRQDYLKLIQKPTTEPLRIFIAHMDHPGFHGIRWESDTLLNIQWHGGSPTALLEGARVWLADQQGWAGVGHLQNAKLSATGRGMDTAQVRISKQNKLQKDPRKLYGGLSFKEHVWLEEQLIYTKAADDLIGTFAIVSTALDWFRSPANRKKAPNFIGLLTRAEEVGFIGAIGHFELGWLKKARRPVLGVSLETSRTLPGAEIGKGPVVRLGDRFTVFDPGALRVFTDLAQSTLPQQHQRRIMDGGTCEATAATVFGYPCVGISVPLGNYHNQCFEGGPEASGPNGPAPEFVHLEDLNGLLSLCSALNQPKIPWKKPWQGTLQKFRKSYQNYEALLRSGP